MPKKTESGAAKSAVKNIGLRVKPPTAVCEDKNCPFHGTLGVRGQVVEGKVVSTKAQRTAIIERQYPHYVSKFERYERRHSRIAAYKPDCIDAHEGNVVRIAECRPLSKTKSFVVVEVVK
ncbi:MAG: 30S ribosomal protein S17 [Candidatus Aenigmarchaeota archaeon]|nr:30S ribosomal protein S17 [Candidatus Aenigmarchaeota archaeon]